MSNTFINIADLKDPDDAQGRSYREVNNAQAHKYSTGQRFTWLDDDGARHYGAITKLTRDCDGTPLYTITEDHHGWSDDSLDEMEELSQWLAK